jgi:hypothetical protein
MPPLRDAPITTTSDTRGFVERYIIDHDDVPALKRGNHTLFDVRACARILRGGNSRVRIRLPDITA